MSRKKIVTAIVLLVISAALAYLLFAPVPIQPGAWTPPAAPALTGQYERNTRLSPVEKLSLGDGHKPEDIALDSQGRIYAGLDFTLTEHSHVFSPIHKAARSEWLSTAAET
jgi:hypothetical protein